MNDDRLNCGGCGVVCGEGLECLEGLCQCPTSAGVEPRACDALGGETCCPGLGCAVLSSRPAACGSCTNACNPGEDCVANACSCGGGLPCPTGTQCCGGVCCGSGQLCCAGQCLAEDSPECFCGSSVCALTELCCSSASGVTACVEPNQDPDHC
ncbi:MAG: hypothetical protein CO108_20405, partial [Deltaproteobacteria bacterium CG_4_9_14_3_um_filter_63_12]